MRFSTETAAQLTACPFCAQTLVTLSAAAALGLKLMAVDQLVDEDPSRSSGE